MVEIIDSKRRYAKKVRSLLREKYPEYNIWFGHDSDDYVSINLKKGKRFKKKILSLDDVSIDLYKKDFLEFAKEVSALLNIDVIKLCYTNDLEY